jgi:hypothetical protein
MAMSDVDRSRRFARRRTDEAGVNGDQDSLAELHAELVLLREENARLKAAEHAGPDVDGLLGRARRLSEAAIDHGESAADEATRVLVEGLAIRESLLEICIQIERVMVGFEKRLRALDGAGQEPEPQPVHDGRARHWFEPPVSLWVHEGGSDGPGAA